MLIPNSTALLPVPVVSSTYPHVILYGHHQVAASVSLGIDRIPVMVVDVEEDYDSPELVPLSIDDKLQIEECRTRIRCYAAADNSRIMISDLVEHARSGTIGFGIKGTRHVAVIHSNEVKLEKVTPKSSGARGAHLAG